jgi:glutamyl-tRNA synthetase
MVRMSDTVVTRISPSPTGEMHIGTVRTALFNYLYAKKSGGTYFVRIEDTDKARNKPEWVDAIWRDFTWAGIIEDARYVQSEHLERHKELLRGLVDSGRAYISHEPKADDATQTVDVVRLKNPGTSVTFEDLVRGTVTFDTSELGDFVIARAIDDPLYHFAVVVDDADAHVTHVIRAEEHISNTPRQILIQEALGFSRPIYAHIPLILAPDRSKLSKRKHNASVEHYRKQGYLAPAMLNYLVLLGWNPGTERELFSLPEMVEHFSIEKVQHSGAIFDEVKLKWFNREYMMRMELSDFVAYAKEFLTPETAAFLGANLQLGEVLRERASTFGEIRTADEAGEYQFFYKTPSVGADALVFKTESKEATIARLERVLALLEPIQGAWTKDSIKEALWPYAEAEGRGQVLWPLRMALSGREKSPDPFTISGIIGYDETKHRINGAITVLRS